MTSTAPARSQRPVVETPSRSIRAVPLPPSTGGSRLGAWLPKEKAPVGMWGALAVVCGFAIAYAGAIAVPTGTSYNLREVERTIALEESRSERLTAERSRLLSLPSVLARVRRLGVVAPAPADVLLAPRP